MKEQPLAKVSTPGSKKKHDVTLLKVFIKEKNPNEPYWPTIIAHAAKASRSILKRSGIELGHRAYRIDSGHVVPFLENDTGDAFLLQGAIYIRDKENGLTIDWFAADILYRCNLIDDALKKIDHSPNFILDEAMNIQQDYFHIFLLENNVQARYSAGKGRGKGDCLNSQFGHEAELLLKQYVQQGKSKRQSYKLVATKLKEKYSNEKTPTEQTITDWFKSRKDIRRITP